MTTRKTLFTKYHYQTLARLIKNSSTNENLSDFMKTLIATFEFDNPRFDRMGFLKECGWEVPNDN